MQCGRCTTILPQGVPVCPVCGFPVAEQYSPVPGESAPQQPSHTVSGITTQRGAGPASPGFAFQEFYSAPASFSPTGSPGAAGLATPYAALPPPASPGQAGYPPFALPGRAALAQPKRRGRSAGWIVLYALLATLLVFVGLGMALYAVGAHFASVNQATQTAAMNLYKQVTGRAPTLPHVLTDPAQGLWMPYQQPDYGCALENDGLHVHITRKNYFAYCTDLSSNLTDFAFQVQAQILSGDACGLVFRLDNKAKSFYYFELDPANGSYRVTIEKDGRKGLATSLVSGISHVADGQPGASNTLTLIAKGAQFDLYVNGNFLIQVRDATYRGGMVGLFASDLGHPTEVAYTDAEIWNLDT